MRSVQCICSRRRSRSKEAWLETYTLLTAFVKFQAAVNTRKLINRLLGRRAVRRLSRVWVAVWRLFEAENCTTLALAWVHRRLHWWAYNEWGPGEATVSETSRFTEHCERRLFTWKAGKHPGLVRTDVIGLVKFCDTVVSWRSKKLWESLCGNNSYLNNLNNSKTGIVAARWPCCWMAAGCEC